MKKNKAKEKFASGEPVYYFMLLSHAAPAIVVLGRAGIDTSCIEGEHNPLDRQHYGFLGGQHRIMDPTALRERGPALQLLRHSSRSLSAYWLRCRSPPAYRA
jgi:hypothetical protein